MPAPLQAKNLAPLHCFHKLTNIELLVLFKGNVQMALAFMQSQSETETSPFQVCENCLMEHSKEADRCSSCLEGGSGRNWVTLNLPSAADTSCTSYSMVGLDATLNFRNFCGILI